MSIIPLRQTVTVYKPGEKDRWHDPEDYTSEELPARVDEKTKVVTNQAGEEVVTSLEIVLDGLADIGYSDEIKYVDEFDRETRRKPVTVEPVRNLAGKAFFTVVYL